MCGILGGVFRRPIVDADVGAFRRAVSTLGHRGPDAEKVVAVEAGRAILAFRRLAIIDIGGGDQPMALPTGQHLVFNGEIYNYRDVRRNLERAGRHFTTQSDSEVLLNALAVGDVDGLSELRGMFGFGFLDLARRRLTLGRDRLGVKQLYFADTDEGTFFASEPKAILALPWMKARLNQRMLPEYFNFRSVPAPHTLFAGISKLGPGTVRQYDIDDLDRVETRAYWHYPERAPISERLSNAESLRAVEDALLTAIERRLVSDVPVGAFLSGGLDSSLVVAGIDRLGRSDVQTFSATFPGAADDEGSFSSSVARRFGLRNHAIPLGAQDFLETLPLWFEVNDDLVADASSLPLACVSARARAERCIVMLAGEGADELFGGYGVYHKYGLLRAAAGLIPSHGARNAIHGWLKRASLVRAADAPRVQEYFVEGRGFLGTAALLDIGLLQELLSLEEPPALPRAVSSHMSDLGAFDFARRIPDDLLVRTDRATMSASIEARVPFLDHDFVEVVARLPDAARAVPGVSKVVLRRLALHWGVPRSTILHRKIGFNVPISEWFSGPLRGLWSQVLDRRAVLGVNYDMVGALVEGHLSGEARREELLWRILSLEAWHARWIDGAPFAW